MPGLILMGLLAAHKRFIEDGVHDGHFLVEVDFINSMGLFQVPLLPPIQDPFNLIKQGFVR